MSMLENLSTLNDDLTNLKMDDTEFSKRLADPQERYNTIKVDKDCKACKDMTP